jgi:hypothetical protein
VRLRSDSFQLLEVNISQTIKRLDGRQYVGVCPQHLVLSLL